jgi:hypothetical protein
MNGVCNLCGARGIVGCTHSSCGGFFVEQREPNVRFSANTPKQLLDQIVNYLENVTAGIEVRADRSVGEVRKDFKSRAAALSRVTQQLKRCEIVRVKR